MPQLEEELQAPQARGVSKGHALRTACISRDYAWRSHVKTQDGCHAALLRAEIWYQASLNLAALARDFNNGLLVRIHATGVPRGNRSDVLARRCRDPAADRGVHLPAGTHAFAFRHFDKRGDLLRRGDGQIFDGRE